MAWRSRAGMVMYGVKWCCGLHAVAMQATSAPIRQWQQVGLHMQLGTNLILPLRPLNAKGIAIAESSSILFLRVDNPSATHRAARVLTSRRGTWTSDWWWAVAVKLDRCERSTRILRYSRGELPVQSLSFVCWRARRLGTLCHLLILSTSTV